MDRLTRREPDGQAIALHGDCGWYGKIVQRLAAYEDTGLTPQEIKSMQEWHDFRDSRDCISADRLRALAEADRDGRCVVLPCKVGTMLYEIAQKWTKCAAFDTERDEYVCQGCEEERCDSHKEFYVRSIKPLSLSELVKYIPNVGKTVFLTRPEAEAALKKEADKHEP